MPDVTQILNAIEDGDPAAEELLPLIYDELRKLAAARMAQESPDHTLQATALVHEAYLRHRAQCLNMFRQLGVDPLPPSAVVEWTMLADS